VREKDRQTERERDKRRERQRETKTDKQRETEKDRETERQREEAVKRLTVLWGEARYSVVDTVAKRQKELSSFITLRY